MRDELKRRRCLNWEIPGVKGCGQINEPYELCCTKCGEMLYAAMTQDEKDEWARRFYADLEAV